MARKPRKRTGLGRKAKYSFRPGSRVKGVKPAAVAAELDRIRQSEGKVTPAAVVEAAESPSSPLHGAFDWDDATAAHEHRLLQARAMIRAVVVTYPDETPRTVYVHVREESGGGYQPMTVVARDPDLFALAIEELTDKLGSAQRAVDELRELAGGVGNRKRVRQVEAVSSHLKAATAAAKGID